MPKQATVTFTYDDPDGVQRWVNKGDVVPDRDPVVKGREALFTDINTKQS